MSDRIIYEKIGMTPQEHVEIMEKALIVLKKMIDETKDSIKRIQYSAGIKALSIAIADKIKNY